MPTTATKIRVVWPNPGEPRATFVRVTPNGRERERSVGPRALLTLDEAAALLMRPREQVQRAIRAGFLRAVRRGSRCYVTMRACTEFIREELEDLAAARAVRDEPHYPADEVFRRLGD